VHRLVGRFLQRPALAGDLCTHVRRVAEPLPGGGQRGGDPLRLGAVGLGGRGVLQCRRQHGCGLVLPDPGEEDDQVAQRRDDQCPISGGSPVRDGLPKQRQRLVGWATSAAQGHGRVEGDTGDEGVTDVLGAPARLVERGGRAFGVVICECLALGKQ
jgi:hypothetical protein